MATKKILGLDLGTNSIGWALIERDFEAQDGKILGMGSRIIPMGQELSKFEKGQAQTKNANRRLARGARKLNKRYKQRRNKLIYVLSQLGMLPDQIRLSSSFDNPKKIDRVCILPIEKNQKQYTALDLLELRNKALKEKVTLKELGRIIYLFNQLRGYAGGGEEEKSEEQNNDDGQEKKTNKRENYTAFGQIISISEPEPIEFKGKKLNKRKVEFLTEESTLSGDTFLEGLKVNESLEMQVNITESKKFGKTITFKLPNKTNWRKKMETLEDKLTALSEEQGREVFLSEYFLSVVKTNKWARVRNNVVLRKRYQAEFDAIWKEQAKHHSILNHCPIEKLTEVLNYLFPGEKISQRNYRTVGLEKGLYHVVRNQIIYFQRELRDQSDLIANCRFEPNEKVVPKSHPAFQEFKLWEQINKLSINTKIEKGKNRKGVMKYEYIDRIIPVELKEWLFEELKDKREIGFGVIYKKLKRDYNLRENIDFLNGMNAKAKLRGDETKRILKKGMTEDTWNMLDLDNIQRRIELWEILYNEKGNEYDIDSARTSKVLSFINRYAGDISNKNRVSIEISKIRFDRNYASLSLKAVNNILPIVRCGKFFNTELSQLLNERVLKLLNENLTDPFEKAAQEYLDKNSDLLVEGGVMNAYATILIYGQHTSKEIKENEFYQTFWDVKRLKQGSLRNPLVEQVINETLMVVRDIWKSFGKPDEIRLELARELKNNAQRRAKMYKKNIDSRKLNDEARDILIECKQEISPANIQKLRLFYEQRERSPYTGQTIALCDLFDKEKYDVDHIIPKSRYFDDSMGNKVISEKSINDEKSNRTPMEYFDAGSKLTRLSKSAFLDHVNSIFHGIKRKNLLTNKLPEDPVTRQLKETQYISVVAKSELAMIVGTHNIKTTTGGVTDYLRNQWGLTDKFKTILKGRYEQAKTVVAEYEYQKYLAKNQVSQKEAKYLPNADVNDVIRTKDVFIKAFDQDYMKWKNNKLIIKGWSKRIDHRHHAIDALVVACTEVVHIKRLNDLNKELQTWLDQHRKEFLPDFEGTPTELLEEVLLLEEKKRSAIFMEIEKFRAIEIPWKGFPEMAENEIKKIIVSQKPKDSLLIQKNNEGHHQIKIRAQLHEGTLYGKSMGIEAYSIPLTKIADVKKIVVNPYLRKILDEHIKLFGSKKEAFSDEGLLFLNKALSEKTRTSEWRRNGIVKRIGEKAFHPPVTAIKVFYRDPSNIKKKGEKEFEPEAVLQKLDRRKAFNNSLYVKTGDNYLFAIMEKDGKRIFDLINLFDATNLIKDEWSRTMDKSSFDKELVFRNYFETKNSAKLLFTLKRGDPVYLPDRNENLINDRNDSDFESFWSDTLVRSVGVHYVSQFTGNQIYFIRHDIAEPIVGGKEFGSQDAYTYYNGVLVKLFCIKVLIDRLGKIIPC